MTRNEMRKRVQMMLGEWGGTDGARNPLQLDTWVTAACDELSRATDAYYLRDIADIAADQIEYCAPEVYKVMAIYARDQSGETRTLSPMTPQQMDRISRIWRSNPASGPPAFYIAEGTNRFRLYPVPNYDSPNGLTVEGYMVPASGWDGDNDECPLPLVAHMGVVFGACRLRIAEMPSPENMARLPLIERMYQESRTRLEREVATRTDATRRHA
ncbi:MAG TPA: hypothetical protein VGK19_21300 [Capsulimonadaceae bacterium]|jgi:hypothetical protein